jgi:hypothetical protein
MWDRYHPIYKSLLPTLKARLERHTYSSKRKRIVAPESGHCIPLSSTPGAKQKAIRSDSDSSYKGSGGDGSNSDGATDSDSEPDVPLREVIKKRKSLP